MPTLSDPQSEARRVAAVRAAVAKAKPWLKSTGPRTAAGKRKMAINRTSHGAESHSLRLALAYCRAVEQALKGQP